MTSLHTLLIQNLQAVVFLAHCAAVGFAANRVLRLFGEQSLAARNGYLELFFAIVSGMTIDLAALFCLGIFDHLTLRAVSICALMLLVIAAPLGKIWQWRISGGNAADIAICGVLLLTITSEAARVPGLWDDTSFHLPLARFYIQHHSFALAEYLRFPLFPQNGDLLILIGLLFDGPTFAQTLATLPLFVIGLGLIGYGKSMTSSRAPGFLMLALLMTLGPVTQTLGYAFIDDALAMFCWGAVVAVAIWIDSGKERMSWLAVAGAFAGMAVGCKFFGGILAALLGLWIFATGRRFKPLAAFTFPALLFGLGWYIRSYLISGDPFHPAGAKLFGYFLWDAGDLAGQIQEQGTLGVKKNLLFLWPALITAGIAPWVVAIAFLLAFKWQPKGIRLLQFVFASYFLFWFFVTQVSRYLAPIYGVGCFLCVYPLVSLPGIRMVIGRSKLIVSKARKDLVALIVLAPIFVWSLTAAAKRVDSWDADLQKKDGYALMQAANSLIPRYGSAMLSIRFEDDIYFFDGTSIGDWFGPGRYRGMFDCPNTCTLIPPADMESRMQKFGANMLLLNTRRLNLEPTNLAAYKAHFDVLREDQSGVLLGRKKFAP